MAISETGKSIFYIVFKQWLSAMFLLWGSCLFTSATYGNNVRINGEPVVQLNSTSDSLSLTFTLSWDNSWRDDFNWDAVWLFVKYKREGSQDAWSHLYLGGSQVGTANLEIDPGNTGSQIVGAFVYPKHKGTFHITGEQVKLKAPLNGLSASDLTEGKIYFAVTGIEMVLIPYGAYYLGDGQSNRTFRSVPMRIIPADADIIGTDPAFSYSCIPTSWFDGTYATPAEGAADRRNNPRWEVPYSHICHISNGQHGAAVASHNLSWMVNFQTPRTIRTFGVSSSTYADGNGNYLPSKDWYLLGSNDSLNWDTLTHCKPEEMINSSVSYPVRHAIRVTHPGSYQYYRLFFLEINNGNNGFMLVNVAMSEQDLYPNSVNNLYVDNENAIFGGKGLNALYAEDGNVWSGSLPAAYPKGYKGFYVMKYELSQEQYVNFLNMLSYAQQKSRIGNNLDNLERGDYVFGDPTQPSCRNGIAVFSNKGTSQPVVFGNNLNPAEPFFAEDDGQTLACNYMTGADMLAYLDWSGLRPLSELEYEKMCRTPNRVTPGEYAWNSTVIHSLGGQSGLSSSTVGTENEVPVGLSTNVNSGMPSFGPVRCGSFGSSTSTQQESGSSFYGVMELSGNLAELYYNVHSASTYNTSAADNSFHGDGGLGTGGEFNVSYWNWSIASNGFSVRGGSFASADSLLRISDRSLMKDYDENRDSTVTFRGGRTPRPFYVDAGSIWGSNGLSVDTTCVGAQFTLEGTVSSTDIGSIAYEWYVSEDNGTSWNRLNITSADLIYNQLLNATTTYIAYQFKRKTVCPLGEAFSNEVTVYVAPSPWTDAYELFTNPGSTAQITVAWGNQFPCQWSLQGAPSGVQISGSGEMSGIAPGMVVSYFASVVPDKCPDLTYTKEIELRRDFVYTGTEQMMLLEPGDYVMECWGAQGGIARSDGGLSGSGGGGGYSYGEIHLTASVTLYLNVGGMGGNAASYCQWCGGGAGGWNGGGTGGYDDTDDAGGGGGGASDIRLESGNLYSRIMVAGGGGGGYCDWTAFGGGGLTGAGSYPGTQTSGGSFGIGSTGYGGGNYACGAGGSGGGYYGGASPMQTTGSGGSGFISGMAGCDAIAGDGDLTPTGQPRHYSGFVFQNAKMQSGIRGGNGLVRIRPLKR